MTQDRTEDMLAMSQKEVADLEAELVKVRESHWELVQQLGHAHWEIEHLNQELRIMERQMERRNR